MFAANSRAFPVQCPRFAASGDLRPMDSPVDVWRPCLSTKICISVSLIRHGLPFFSLKEFRITWFSGWWYTPLLKMMDNSSVGMISPFHSQHDGKVMNPAMYISPSKPPSKPHRVWQWPPIPWPPGPKILTPHMPAHGGGRSPRRGLTSSTWPGGNADAKRRQCQRHLDMLIWDSETLFFLEIIGILYEALEFTKVCNGDNLLTILNYGDDCG